MVEEMDLELRPMQRTDEDLELFRDCFNENGSPRTKEQLRWQYLENPAPHLCVDFAVDHSPARERLAAIYATLPNRVYIDGQVHLGVQSVDTLTDHRYRGQGLFTRLADAVFERCKSETVALVYGFPNGHSAHGFFERLDWTSLDPVPFLIRPLRLGYFLKKAKFPKLMQRLVPNSALYVPALGSPLAKGEVLRPIDSFGDETDELWKSFRGGFDISVDRSTDYLNWRTSKPGENYQRAGIFAGNDLLGLVIWTTKDKHGGRIGYVLEMMHRPSLVHVGQALLAHAIQAMARDRADAVLAWNFPHSPNHGAYRRNAFLPLPEKFRPIELHVGARELKQNDARIRKRRAWYISYLDSDTV